jgi:Uri superfamily endonuclease
MKGIYCLILKLDKHASLRIGKRLMSFPDGYYCYVGSALNNVEKRIERHKSKSKKKHWHIDYLTPPARIVAVKVYPTHRKMECTIAQKVAATASETVRGFGSSDCGCAGHLYFFRRNPATLLRRIFYRDL